MDYQKLFPQEIVEQLVENWKRQQSVKGTSKEIDFQPVCKLHIPCTDMFWLLTELDKEEAIAFGLCQIHCAELGDVWLPELADLDVKGLQVVMDKNFKPNKTLSGYADMARHNGGFLAL